MPTLQWIGKDAVKNHHNEVPYHLLRCNPDLSVGEEGSGNLLVQGDNLLALKALLPYYGGQVKCIYIDPPYNTGEERWIYNDKVNSPEIRTWLGNVVGSEAEDLSRHDKWLCMMYPRVSLLKQFLKDDGIFWMSIDDNEVQNARCILDEIFGRQNFIASIVWQKRTAPESRKPLGPAHDYILVYGKNREETKRNINKITLSQKRINEYKNPDNDPRGPWASRDITGQVGHATEDQFYEITTPQGNVFGPPTGRCWTISRDTFEELLKDDRIYFGTKGASRPRMKLFLSETQGTSAWTWWSNKEVGHNQEATKELIKIFSKGAVFETPKPVRLLYRIINLSMKPGDIILDSFCGTGTTGHALLEYCRERNIEQKFILIEMDNGIAKNISSVRLRRVIHGYDWKDQKGKTRHEEGLGGGFCYCELGPTLFESDGQIRSEVSFPDLARHVFFTETGQPLPAQSEEQPETTFLGSANGRAVYLLYNGVLKDKRPISGNILNKATLAELPSYEGPKVVYGVGCTLSPARLAQLGITFKQIPYQIKVG